MITVIFELLLLFGNVQGIDWCQEGCGWLGQKHVKCIFKWMSSNELCPKIQSVISQKERKDILNYHNAMREDVARGTQYWRIGTTTAKGWPFDPSYASNMRQMVWDYDLEENAGIYASQCNVKSHQPYDCATTQEFRLVHMNKYDNALRQLWMDQIFTEWVKENKKVIRLFYSEDVIIRTYIPGPWDDFIATIFSQTYKLGCAKVVCNCNQREPLYKAGSVACLYGPAPNFSSNGYPVYEINPPCSSCPNGTSCKYHSTWPHLCARPGDPIKAEDIPSRDKCGSHLPSLLLFSLIMLSH